MVSGSDNISFPGVFNEPDWFALAIQTAHVPVGLSRLSDSCFVEVNSAFLHLFGYRREEVIGHSATELGMWPDPKARNRLLSQLRQGGTVTRFEAQYRHHSGAIGELLISARIVDVDGLSYLIGFLTDVTEQRRLERLTQTAQDRLRAVLTSQSQLVFHQDLDLRYTWIANPAFGFTSEEILGRNDDDLLGSQTAAPLVAIKRRVLASGQAERHEVWLTHKGQTRGYDLRVLPERDTSGVLAGLVCAATDITQTRVGSEDLRLTLESLGDGFIALDAEWRFIYVNAVGEKLLGLSREELLGRNHWDIFPDTLGTPLEAAYRKAAAGEPQVIESYGPPWRRWFLSRSFPRKDGGISVYFLDITERKEADAKLREIQEGLRQSEERFRYAMEAAREGLWDWNLATGEVYYSPGYFTMLGHDPQAFPRDVATWIRFLHPDEADMVTAEAQQRLREPGHYTLEFRMRSATGDYRWILSSGKVVERDADGRPLRAIGTHLDITNQKAATQELERIRFLLEEGERIAHLGCWEYIVATQETVWSDEECRIFGLEPDQPSPNYQTMLRQYIHPEDAETLHRSFQLALENQSLFELEYRIRRPDGSLRVVRNLARPYFDEAGRLIKYIGTTLDVTEFRQLEDSVVQSEALLRSLIESTSDAVFIKDLESRYLLLNSATADFLGQSVEEVLGQDDCSLFPPEEARLIMEADRQVMAEGKVSTYEEQITTADGVSRTFLSTKGPLRDAKGQVMGLFGIAQDTTEIRRREQEHLTALTQAKIAAETANIAKSRFLANMSHELRTPLNAITGMTHLLRRSGVTAEQADRLNKIEAASKHLLEIISAVLDLAKIEMGKFNLEETDINLEEVMAVTLSMLEPVAHEKALKIRCQSLPPLPPLRGDAQCLKQALLNYVGNAVKFTETGTISLRTLVEQEASDSVLVRFEVEDSGVGIAPEDMETLFKPFQQVDAGSTRKHGGTGLGLAITRELAKLMGGEVGVQSSFGQGSTFWFTARLKKQPQLPPSPADTSGSSSPWAESFLKVGFADRRLMVVEDDEINREVACILLGDIWPDIDTAVDGQEAVEKVAEAAYDLILMDLHTPRMGGLDAAKQIRQMPNGREAILIALTADAMADTKAGCLAAGMNDLIAKPFDPEAMFATILHWLSR